MRRGIKDEFVANSPIPFRTCLQELGLRFYMSLNVRWASA
jgi:hypothetical protein